MSDEFESVYRDIELGGNLRSHLVARDILYPRKHPHQQHSTTTCLSLLLRVE
jgi:hypothetical protein